MFVDASTRPVLLKIRPDLVIQEQCQQGRTCWVVKDPIALKYYRFQPEEHFLLASLDGQRSLEELKQRFEARFTPQRITMQQLTSLLGAFHERGLVLADVPGQGRPLRKRGEERAAQQWNSRLLNILSIRLPAFDPDPLLTWLDGWCGWLFTTPALVAAIGLMLAALGLIVVEFEAFVARLPSFHEFFGPHNWFWLGLIVVVTKVLHEFGHGLSCKRFGGECHEMGVLLLVFMPCLYCNVTDSWMLPNKWQRIAIDAAGMYIELILASIAVFVWWFTAPGLLHYLALNVIFVCSVTTLLFNANPLLRYDGYYMLGDWLEIPNLRQKGDQLLEATAAHWLLGLETPPRLLPGEQEAWWLAAYALAAGCYRWIVTCSILLFLNSVLEPHGLKVLGQALACAAAVTMIGVPLWHCVSLLRLAQERKDAMSTLRASLLLGGAALALAFLGWVPLPYSVFCPVQLAPRDAATVYVSVPGELCEILVQPGERVVAGQPLARLENLDVELAITKLAGERDVLLSRLQDLQRRALREETAALALDHTQEQLAALDEQLRKRIEDRERLVLRAPTAGTVLPPERVAPEKDEPGRLRRWTGTPLEVRNLGASLAAGVVFCRIGDPRKLTVQLAIDQQEVEFVQAGQKVDVLLDQWPGERLTSDLASVAHSDLRIAPRGLSAKAGGQIATTTDEQGFERPVNVTYQASAPIDDESGVLFPGVHGQARIHAGHRTLASRLWRYASETFNFRM